MPKTRLSNLDYAALEKSSSPREIADAAGLFRVTSLEGSELAGRKHGDCSGIVFPYRWPGEAGVVLHRLRLDHFALEAGKVSINIRRHQKRGTGCTCRRAI